MMHNATRLLVLLIVGTPFLVYPFHILSIQAYEAINIGYFVIAFVLGRIATKRESERGTRNEL